MFTRIFVLISAASLSIACVSRSLGQDTAAPVTPTPATTAPATTAPAEITWDQAKDHIGDEAVVTGPVVGTHDFGGAVVLNVGKDFPDAGRFTVFLSEDGRKGMPDDLDQGKTIRVTGKIKLYKKVAEIEADAAHIQVVDAGASAPTSAPATQP